MASNRRRTQKKRHVKRIDVLPDDVLLEIFDFYVDMRPLYGMRAGVEAWHVLVHVCRRWRSLVLRSPRRLNLQLYCTPKTPTKNTLDVWPAFPLIVRGVMTSSSGTDNIIAALTQSNRVCQVDLDLAGRELEKVLAMMQVPFPELTDLRLNLNGVTVPVIPDSFLNESALRLRYFSLSGIPFPGLPKLLSSATHLVNLWLSDIHSRYISPEAMVAALSVLSRLETFSLRFESPLPHPDWESRSLPPLERFILPALNDFRFKGVTEYLEDLVTFIDAPQLETLYITFFHQIDLDCPRLAQFINRTPTLGARDEAHVEFDDYVALVRLPQGHRTLQIVISCREPDWQLSSIEQVCNFSLHPLSTVKDLYIKHDYSQLVWKNNAIENTLWLRLLLPFTAVENLYLSKEFAQGIASALQELVGARITEVLPNLQNIFVKELRVEPSGPFQENIGQFVVARQLSGHPIAISDWDEDSDMESM